MGKSGDDEPGFSFAKLAGAENYKKWAPEMLYSLESAGLWYHTLPDKENPKPIAIIFKEKKLEDYVKLERQKNRVDMIIAWTKNNVQCKSYIGQMCLGHIQQEFQAVKTDWLANNLWEWVKKRYSSEHHQ